MSKVRTMMEDVRKHPWSSAREVAERTGHDYTAAPLSSLAREGRLQRARLPAGPYLYALVGESTPPPEGARVQRGDGRLRWRLLRDLERHPGSGILHISRRLRLQEKRVGQELTALLNAGEVVREKTRFVEGAGRPAYAYRLAERSDH